MKTAKLLENPFVLSKIMGKLPFPDGFDASHHDLP
jgi:hypothetical protein